MKTELGNRRATIAPGIVADARRALYLEEAGALVVADLHLGYAWAHRAAGQLMPVSAGEDTVERLAALAADYEPRAIVLLGDIVHRAVAIPPLVSELQRLAALGSAGVRLHWIGGNHDRGLPALLAKTGLDVSLEKELEIGAHTLVHGDAALADEEAARAIDAAIFRGGRVIIGHEHPVLHLGDGFGARARCPAFALGEAVIILPAFSPLAAGSDLRNAAPMSPLARADTPRDYVAILAGKLLPIAAPPRPR